MKTKSLESFIESSWNFAKKTIGSSRAKKATAFIFGGIAYFGLGTEANAQVTSIIDSISISAGYSPENRGPQRFREPVWELKDGVPQVRKTIDFGIVKVDGPPWNLPGLVYGSGFGVDYVDAKWDTVVVIGKVYRYPEDTPIEGAGVNLWNAYSPAGPSFNGEALWGNYLEDRAIYTDKDGKFSMPLHIKVQKAPESIDSVVTVLFPNDGEKILGASVQEISWENNYNGNNFKVSFSTDNGKNWEYIDNGTEFKNGSSSVMKYDWKIPNNIVSDSCLVKVEDDKNSKVYDISDKVFSIDIDTYVESTELYDGVPKKFSVSQNYPNPFNPTSVIKYSVPKQTYVILKIYNDLGEELSTLVQGFKTPGNYTVEVDATKLPSGAYFYKLQAGNYSETKKMVIIK